eukprot:777875_1
MINQKKTFVIYYDKNNPYGGRRNAESIAGNYDAFVNKRRFQRLPLERPRIEELDYNNLDSLRDGVRNNPAICSVFIIPNDMRGSKQKIDISRWCLWKQSPAAALSVDIQKSSRQKPYKDQYRQREL